MADTFIILLPSGYITTKAQIYQIALLPDYGWTISGQKLGYGGL